ncbi:hypothetical protein KVR01_004307 [Diaporthe batatas]|uniref:uncharacterized protein n=1 Tax=Diaporthe batatas TaxID=748121 RepID=UPI001D03DFC5|nr:uncharacterized protein KVR01_004307 [Diaporthe batatas]KAG8165755.1 hypothetical protein KVR01_004307 [Diaporthe batatas]
MLYNFLASCRQPYWIQLLIILPLAIPGEAQSSCVPRPVSIAIGNVSVANSPADALARGVAIGIGDPPQSFAFLPDTTNNSYVYRDDNSCPATYTVTDNECITIRGGAYVASQSESHEAGAFDDTVTDSKYEWQTTAHTDSWRLNEQVSLPGYTFGVPSSDNGNQLYLPQALLGLGRDSTLLRALRDGGEISSRTWSYYWGLDGRGAAKSNGSLVLGGFDQDKISGTTNYTAKLNYTGCDWGTQVQISDIRLNFVNNTIQTLFDDVSVADENNDEFPSLPLYACIDPGTATMFGLPYVNYMSNFVEYTNFSSFNEYGLGNGSVRSAGLHFWDLMYIPEAPQGDRYWGGISVDINGGPSISVPNNQLVVPHVYIDSETSRWEEDPDRYDLLIRSGSIGDFTNRMVLGRDFMANMYIMVNLDADEFTIWPANTDSNQESLVPVDESGNVIETSSFCQANPNTTLPAPDPQPEPDTTSQLSTGAIVGIAIGCAAAVGLLAAGVWWFFRRNKHVQQPKANATPETLSQTPWATPPPPFINDPNKHNGFAGDRSTMLSSGSYLDANHPSGTPNPSELSSSTPTYVPRQELQG